MTLRNILNPMSITLDLLHIGFLLRRFISFLIFAMQLGSTSLVEPRPHDPQLKLSFPHFSKHFSVVKTDPSSTTSSYQGIRLKKACCLIRTASIFRMTQLDINIHSNKVGKARVVFPRVSTKDFIQLYDSRSLTSVKRRAMKRDGIIRTNHEHVRSLYKKITTSLETEITAPSKLEIFNSFPPQFVR